MKSTKISFILLVGALISCKGDQTVTPPPPPESQLVTFQGRAFLDGQPEPVNALHLPLHYDIQIISYLLGNSASYDTVYTDSSGSTPQPGSGWMAPIQLCPSIPITSPILYGWR